MKNGSAPAGGRLNRQVRKMGVAAVAAALFGVSFLTPVTAYGAAERPAEVDEALWARLQDNTMEFDEIPDLVKYYNPTYQNLLRQTGEITALCNEAARELRDEAKDYAAEAKDLKDDASMTGQYMYAAYKAMEDAYKQAAKEFEKLGRSADRATSSMRSQILKQLTSGVQQMFILYNQTAGSMELCDTAAELAEAALQMSQTQAGLGMATDTDVQSARKSLLSAQNQQQTVRDGMTTLRQNLCSMTGWSYDAMPEIGGVPQPDLSRIDAMNPETDIDRAIVNNYAIDSLEDSMKGSDYYSRKTRAVNEAEQKLKTQLETLYQTVLTNRAAWEAANTALAAAELNMAAADRQYQLGMVGRLQYLQLKLAYLQQKMTATSASLTLTQSILNYEWALDGLASLD